MVVACLGRWKCGRCGENSIFILSRSYWGDCTRLCFSTQSVSSAVFSLALQCSKIHRKHCQSIDFLWVSLAACHFPHVCDELCACVRACVRACARARARVCVFWTLFCFLFVCHLLLVCLLASLNINCLWIFLIIRSLAGASSVGKLAHRKLSKSAERH